MMDLHSGYRQATVFDQLWLVLARGLRWPACLRGGRAWGCTFAALALLFGGIGAAFLLNALQPAAQGGALASLGSALLSLGVFHHFARCALPLLQSRSASRPAPLPRVEGGPPAPARQPAPARPAAQGGVQPAVPTLTASERRAYLADLRSSGVNVRIARALVTAGFFTGAAVRRASDAEILAVHGVGPATLRKIRACFPG